MHLGNRNVERADLGEVGARAGVDGGGRVRIGLGERVADADRGVLDVARVMPPVRSKREASDPASSPGKATGRPAPASSTARPAGVVDADSLSTGVEVVAAGDETQLGSRGLLDVLGPRLVVVRVVLGFRIW